MYICIKIWSIDKTCSLYMMRHGVYMMRYGGFGGCWAPRPNLDGFEGRIQSNLIPAFLRGKSRLVRLKICVASGQVDWTTLLLPQAATQVIEMCSHARLMFEDVSTLCAAFHVSNTFHVKSTCTIT